MQVLRLPHLFLSHPLHPPQTYSSMMGIYWKILWQRHWVERKKIYHKAKSSTFSLFGWKFNLDFCHPWYRKPAKMRSCGDSQFSLQFILHTFQPSQFLGIKGTIENIRFCIFFLRKWPNSESFPYQLTLKILFKSDIWDFCCLDTKYFLVVFVFPKKSCSNFHPQP